LILAAVNGAFEKAQKLANEKMGQITGGLNIPGLM
jgi:DNA-binding protein YbaB